ncbi:MAG: N-acetylmuramoyl-L-alanine amidase, partial [Chitinophagaceae bacterium]|nr:N-acetylmuramoyl-L-alanine amidase [Chitinophagaceae bacterium]
MKIWTVLIGLLTTTGLLAQTTPPRPPLRTVVVDAGHGGPDGGAKGSIAREAQLALEISLKIRDLLKQELP